MTQVLEHPVAILVNMVPGYSDYILGQSFKDYLERQGVTVAMFDKKTTNLFAKARGHHLVSYYTDMVWPLYKYARHARPKSVMHIQCIGPKVYPEHEFVAYQATLTKPKMSGIPVKHVNVSPFTEHHFRTIARKYFAPSVCRNIEARTVANYYGLDTGFEVWDAPDPDHLVVPYNRWDPGCKNIPLHMELSNVYKTISERRSRAFAQTFYINGDDYAKHKHEIPGPAHDVYTFKDQYYDREAFYAAIGGHGMFLSTSVRESFGLYFLELLVAGVVGVFHKQSWINTLLPEYPFMGAEGDLVPMMEWVRDNYPEARGKVLNDIRPLLLERYSAKTYLDNLLAELVQLEAEAS